MRITFNHDTKIISVHLVDGDKYLDLDGWDGWVGHYMLIHGYKLKIFDTEGKEVPDDAEFKIEFTSSKTSTAPQ